MNPIRGFGIETKDSKTHVDILEYSDGDTGIVLITKRENMQDIVTSIRLSPSTFRLLSEALWLVHNPNSWKNIEETK